jgi:pimeloyl-ACP methyl ester carboxylesterase
MIIIYKNILGTLSQALTFCLAGLLCALSVVAAEVPAGSTWLHSDSVLDLPIGTVTKVDLDAGEVAGFSLPVTAGTTYTLDLASTSHAAVLVTDSEGEIVGRFQAAHGMTFTASSHSTYTLSVSGNGHEPIHARLAAYTGELPFYRPAAEEERPEFMTNPWYEGAEFGYVYVPADRSLENRHSYRLAILQMPGGPDATISPLVFLTGGPGVSAFNGAFLKAPFTKTCPVIAVNQRGTYLSQPDLFPISPEETTLDFQARLGGPEGIDFNTINTRQNAADILDVMTALGHHEPFNLWGTSYGTMLAQEVIRQAPERIRAAVLDGVVTLDQPQWTIIGQTFMDALNALFDDVAKHPEASLLYPDFEEQLFALAADRYPDGHAEFFENQVFPAMNMSRWAQIENLPGIIWGAARGEIAALDEIVAIHPMDPPPPDMAPISAYMYSIMLRQDFLPFESMDTAEALTNSIPFPLNMLGLDYSRFQYDLTEDWAFLDPAPPSFRQPITNDVPVLILNGAYDTQTGLAGARHVADHLPNSYYVELPTTGHVVLFGGEAVYQIARDFLVDPSQPPDTSAVSGLSLEFSPPWPPDAPIINLHETVTQNFEAAGQASWYRFSAQSNLGYVIELEGAALYILDEQARVLFASKTSGRWTAGEGAEVHLMLVAETPGTYGLRLDRFLNEYSILPGF